MAETFDMLRSYTPQEISQLQQILSQRYQDGVLQNQNMNTVANMTKNLSPAANLGIALGTLGGKWAAQRYNDLQDKDFLKKYDEYLNRQRELNQLPSFEDLRNSFITANLPSFEEARNSFMTNPTPPTTVQATSILTGGLPSNNSWNNFDWRKTHSLMPKDTYFANPYQPTEWDKMQARYNGIPQLLRYNHDY